MSFIILVDKLNKFCVCIHKLIKKRINTLHALTSCHSHPKNILQISVHSIFLQFVHLHQPTIFFFIYIIFLLYHSLTLLACAYITREISKIEINGKIISIFVHQRDLLLGNMFLYIPKTKPVPRIR